MKNPSFSPRTGLGPVRKRYLQMALRNGISLGMKKKPGSENVLAKVDEIVAVNFLDQASKSQK